MQKGTGAPPRQIMNLFTRLNYQFSSVAPGRSSTFYFTDSVGNQGRYRRQHAEGPDLVYQGRCDRVFISPELQAKLTMLAELADPQANDQAFNEVRYGKIAAIHPILTRLDPTGMYRDRASLNAMAGWRLFDTNSQFVHFSAGQILMTDPDAINFFTNQGDAVLSKYSGPWTIW